MKFSTRGKLSGALRLPGLAGAPGPGREREEREARARRGSEREGFDSRVAEPPRRAAPLAAVNKKTAGGC